MIPFPSIRIAHTYVYRIAWKRLKEKSNSISFDDKATCYTGSKQY